MEPRQAAPFPAPRSLIKPQDGQLRTLTNRTTDTRIFSPLAVLGAL